MSVCVQVIYYHKKQLTVYAKQRSEAAGTEGSLRFGL